MNKLILDPCCGSRMMWFDRQHPDALYGDIRTESHTLCDGRALEISPDVELDFRQLPFPDNTFRLVVFDPPHFKNLGKTSWLAKKYGKLLPTWELDIKAGFDECMRVLKPEGVLIFKWNQHEIPTQNILDLIQQKPLFGHTTDNKKHTIWMTFMK